MPEFILDHGSEEGSYWLSGLDEFACGYVEAMFFTSTGYAENGDLEHASVAELSEMARRKIIADCKAFQEKHAEDLAIAYGIDDYDSEKAGRDFWYTRNGHGVGYWDRDLNEVGDKLTDAAHAFGEVDLYRGDDGDLYLSP